MAPDGCEVCRDAPAVATVDTDDGDLDLCGGCAEIVGESEGWRLDDVVPTDAPAVDVDPD